MSTTNDPAPLLVAVALRRIESDVSNEDGDGEPRFLCLTVENK